MIPGEIPVRTKRRRLGVWLVLKLWRIMPRRARVWAFLNDC